MDLTSAQRRVSLAFRDYFTSIRRDMDELLGPGNHGLEAAVLMGRLLGEGQLRMTALRRRPTR